MERYIASPNLPHGKVTLCAVSSKYPDIVEEISTLFGCSVIEMPPCEALAPPVASHADMLCAHLGGSRVVVHKYSDALESAFLAHGFEIIQPTQKLKADYPHDIALNGAFVGGRLICNSRYTDHALLACADEIINVAQGYAKCSTAIVDNSSIITTDAGIARLAAANGMAALLVDKDSIVLEGYDCGFIGGCCFKPAPDKLYFTGKLAAYRDSAKIAQFLDKRGIELICGKRSELIDIGSIIPLLEEKR